MMNFCIRILGALGVTASVAVSVAAAKSVPTDHKEVLKDVKTFGKAEFAEGERLYNMVCAACHGKGQDVAPVPNARLFHKDKMLNGHDPVSMFNTLTKGYKMMPAQTGISAEERYYIIHYIREQFFKKRNKAQYVALTDAYIGGLKGAEKVPWNPKRKQSMKKTAAFNHDLVDHGDAIFGHFEASVNNKAPKGVVIGLEEGGVNVAKEHALYDLDTGRLVAFNSGRLLDWRDINYDSKHRVHARLAGELIFESPAGMAWAKPGEVSPGRYPDFRDPREEALNGRKYGPLPKGYFKYKGLVMTTQNPALHYSIGETEVIEMPSAVKRDDNVGYVRSLLIQPHKKMLYLRVHAKYSSMHVYGNARLLNGGRINEGILIIKPSDKLERIDLLVNASHKEIPRGSLPKLEWPQLPTENSAQYLGKSAGVKSKALEVEYSKVAAQNGFSVEEVKLPQEAKNPWYTRIRPAGVDFIDENTMALASWSGGVYLMENVQASDGGKVKVSRLAAGLHQPLGLKVRNGEIFVGCRDQIMRLHDFDNDAKADYYEAFNSDHVLSMHFHEFAGGLDTDKEGNFYYVKCSHHQDAAFFPRHGTLIKVSKDGKSSKIMANGLRSCNGCFVDKNGDVWVTDQEGFWNPQNKITKVELGKFHGNMLGYHDPKVISASDDDMVEPMVWLPKAFLNSPSEVFRFPDKGWGGLNGVLGYYEYGKGYLVALPYEEKDGLVQGAANPIALPQFATGIMRGKFHPKDHALYSCGLFGWGSSRVQRGGFYRVRYTGEGAYAMTGFTAKGKTVTIKFSDKVSEKVLPKESIKLRSYTIERSARYGSKMDKEIRHKVSSVAYLDDGYSVRLTVPDLVETRVLRMGCKVVIDGKAQDRKATASIYSLK